MYAWYDVMNSTLHLCDLPLKNSEPQPKHKKNITRQIPTEASSTVLLMRTPQNRQGHQQQTLRNCHEKSKGDASPLDFSWQFLRVCCWWPWRFWGVLIRSTVEDASVGICLVMFFLCLGCGSEFLRGRSQRWSVEFITSYQAYMLPRWFMTHGADLDQRLMQCLLGFSADKVLFTCLSTLASLEGGHYA